jgi:hypothetical protein
VDNKTLIEKATLTVADITTDGGLLNPEQANKFIRTLIQIPTILSQVRTVEMTAPTRNINKIVFGSAILKPGVSNTALLEADRSKPQTSQIVLNTDEVIAEVRLPYDVIEDNIERGNIGTHREGGAPNAGGGLIETVLTLIAERAALDLENLALNGDTTLTGLLGLQDGYIKLAETGGNVSDAAGANISKEIFKDGMKVLPDQYLTTGRANMRHYVSQDQETEFRDTVANRATAVGDAAHQGYPGVFAFGVPVEAATLMPEDKGLFTNPNNLLWGIQRQVMLEWDKDITARVLIIVLTARVALQVEETDALVVYNNIGG